MSKKVPETGGDTLWANMALAYDRLAPHLQAMIDELKRFMILGVSETTTRCGT